jgi:hypothetical protein
MRSWRTKYLLSNLDAMTDASAAAMRTLGASACIAHSKLSTHTPRRLFEQ